MKTSPAGPRADAVQNRERILDAADIVFAEHDTQASLDLIVQASGVSRTTLFRHFPDRQALLAALLHRALDELEALAMELRTREDALFVVLRFLAGRVRMRASIVDYWHAADRSKPEVQLALRRTDTIFAPLIAAAKTARLARSDLGLDDIAIFASMLAGLILSCPPPERNGVLERGLTLLLEGMRSVPQSHV